MFYVLESGINEYGEIIMQHFSSCDNNYQLRIVLCMLRSCGLSPPFAFSDVTNRDLCLLDHIFPLLTNGLEDHGNSDENASSLPIISLTGPITFPNSIESIISAIDILDDDLNGNYDNNDMVVSIDF